MKRVNEICGTMAATNFILFTFLLYTAIPMTKGSISMHFSESDEPMTTMEHHESYETKEEPHKPKHCFYSENNQHNPNHDVNDHHHHHHHDQEPKTIENVKYDTILDNKNWPSSLPMSSDINPFSKMKSDKIVLPLMKMVDRMSGAKQQGIHSRNNDFFSRNHQNQDRVYELINHRFSMINKDSDVNRDHLNQDHQQQQYHDQMQNWRTWSNEIKYFPSGQKQVKKHWQPQALIINPHKSQTGSNQHIVGPQLDTNLLSKGEKDGNQKSIIQNISVNYPEPPAIKEVLMVATSKEQDDGDSMNELDQQNHNNHLDKIVTMHEDLGVKVQEATADQFENQIKKPELTSLQQADTAFGGKQQVVARDYNTTPLNQQTQDSRTNIMPINGFSRDKQDPSSIPINLPTSPSPYITSPYNSNILDAGFESVPESMRDTNVRQLYSPADQIRRIEATQRDSNTTTRANILNSDTIMEESASIPLKFLGYGELQRIKGNGRLQARLNCQFGDDGSVAGNMTIWNVEWAKFINPYNVEQRDPPPFDCEEQRTPCHLEKVKTDVVTTVHPRPLKQSFVHMQAPSYSVTLHKAEEDQLGVYRCSAMRHLNDGNNEIVYRIIPFQK